MSRFCRSTFVCMLGITVCSLVGGSRGYCQIAGQLVHSPQPLGGVPTEGSGSIEGWVYWAAGATAANPADACNGFSVTVIAGGHAMVAASGQFGARFVGQVKSALSRSAMAAYDVCTYSYDHLPVNTPLNVQLAIVQRGGFRTSVAPANALVGPITIVNGKCNMLPAATPSAADLTAHFGSCQNMAFDVNFHLVANGSTAMSAPPSGTVMQQPLASVIAPRASGQLLNQGPQQTMLGGTPAAGSRGAPGSTQPMLGGGTNPNSVGLTPLGRSNPASGTGSGAPSGGLRPLIPRGNSDGSSTAPAGGSGKPLTNADVVNLLRAGIAESIIVSTIRAHAAAFDVSDQGRANFDTQCAALQPAGVSAGAWGSVVSDIWQTMNNIVICQQTNGRGGEGACDQAAHQPSQNNNSMSSTPMLSKAKEWDKYDPITLQQGTTQAPGFAKWANNTNSGTTAAITDGTRNADELNPQPYPPKGAPSGSASPSPDQALTVLLERTRMTGKSIPMSIKRSIAPSNASMLSSLQKQHQQASTEAAQMVQLRNRAPATSAGPSQTMSATAIGPTGFYSRTVNDPAALVHVSMSPFLLCAQDPTMRILTVSGSATSATFTPIDEYNLYTIRGCSFGNEAPTNDSGPTDWVHIYGGAGSFYGKFAIKFWSDNEIDVSLDGSLSGFPDLSNITLVVKRGDGQQTQKGGFNFYAARQTVLLNSIPQSWVTLASFPEPFQHPWTMTYSSPPASSRNATLYPTPAIGPPGPTAGSAYVSRSSNGDKYASVTSAYDYFDFSHLAAGWTTDPSDQQHQPELITFDQYCPAGDGWTVTYKESFGSWSSQWDGNNIQVGLSDTSCSGFFGPSLGINNYENWSGSYYALKVWVTGPRGTDPLTDKPTL